MSDKISLLNKIITSLAKFIALYSPPIVKYWTIVYAAGQTAGNPNDLTVGELIDLVLKVEQIK